MSGIKRWYHSELYNEIRKEDYGQYVLHSDHVTEVARLRAEVEGLRQVLKKAWEDVNWMTNEGTLLRRECFWYLDAAMGEGK